MAAWVWGVWFSIGADTRAGSQQSGRLGGRGGDTRHADQDRCGWELRVLCLSGLAAGQV